jgi:CBS domain-containing protein
MDAVDPVVIHPAVRSAGDIMSAPAITVPADSTRTTIADTLTRHRISAVPVVDDSGQVLGLVSEHDLLAKPGDVASELMTTAVISVTEGTPIEDIRHLLIDRRIRRVPVLRGGELVGVVSRGDVVATMATEWVCDVCGEAVRGPEPPAACPKCHSGPERFTHQEQPPGA